MLGRLARWLRTLGYDALYEGDGRRGDEAMAEQAARERRVLVTRDRAIAPRPGLRIVVLGSASARGQLRETLEAIGAKPDPARWFTRCTVCNLPLAEVPRAEGLAEAPERVRGLETRFYRCGGCRKLYWMGTHTAASAATLKAWGF